jgi:pimeloyl-ACP methyl ester carboxylesterase
LLGVAAVFVISAGAFLAYRAWDPGSIRGSFDVGDRSLYIECVGAGAPTIVMETGLGGDHSAWEQVVPDLRGANQTCTYDRANVGESDQAPTPRTSADVVADLHGLLEAAGIPAPYVLVGHSFGGISMRLYASTYPDDVAGLVLVDPTPTTFVDDACAIVDETACESMGAEFEPSRGEGLDLVGSANALSAAGPLPAVPLLVLVADDHSQDAVTDPEQQQRFEAMWQGRQQELATSVQGGRMELVSSGHNIQSLRPEAVTEAIRSVISELPPAP